MDGYGKEVDMWSVGVIMYILLCGFPPFYEENTAQLFKQIMEGRFDFPEPYWTNVSESAKDLIRNLLVVDPKSRLSAEDALRHPWITGTTAKPDVLASTLYESMDKFNVSRKFKVAIHATIASLRLANAAKQVLANASPSSSDSSTQQGDAA